MNIRILSILIVPFLLSACSAVGIATGLGATAGVSAAQEGGLSRAWTDAKIQAQINDLWFRYDVETFSKLDLTVNQGRVLITGVVQDPEQRVEAVRLAWQPAGVKQVINEIRVADSDGIVGFARDAWISTRLRTAITLDRDVQSINYNIDTVQGTVYLMGVAESQVELNRVIETARTIPDVKQVVSYMKLAGDQPQNYVPDNSSAAMTGTDMGADPYPYNDPDPYPEMPEGYTPDTPAVNGNAPQPLTRNPAYDSGTSSGGNVPEPVEREEIYWN